MTIPPISSIAALPMSPIGPSASSAASPAVSGATAATSTTATAGAARPDFGNLVAQGLEKLQNAQSTSDSLAVQATTGDLQDIHDYMIASNEATLATQLTVAVRNKAVEAFTEIMRMQM